MNDPSAQSLLKFWFGDRPMTPTAAQARKKLWFSAGAGFDREIETRFTDLTVTARSGALDHWEEDDEDCLALILLLDQLPRNLYRGQAQAFDSDARALELANGLSTPERLAQLGFSESAFALMPYQHSEDLEAQRRGVALYHEQMRNAPPGWKEIMQDYCRHAELHLDIVERFGRFPHRNEVLGRPDTEEELQWLRGGGERFGQ